MADASSSKLGRLGGWRGLLRNPGLFIHTWRAGAYVGADARGNHFYQTRPVANRRPRRWVVYAGPAEASSIGPEWHGWLSHTTDAPLPEDRRPWQLPHQPNRTGTPDGYRPAGHDYNGGARQPNQSDYQAWTPDA